MVGILQFNDLNLEIFSRVIVGTQKLEIVVHCRRSRFTPVFLGAVATPNDTLRFSVGNNIFMAIMQQHLTTLR